MIRTLIADDEPLARRRLARLLATQPDIQVVAQCVGGQDALDAIQEHTPDLLLLDVQMPDLNAFEVLAKTEADPLPAVVFVTAFDQYALRAFDAHAVDYLLKPYNQERLEVALQRVRQWLDGRDRTGVEERMRRLLVSMLPDGAGAPRPRGPHRLALKVGGRTRIVAASDVDWFESDGNYVRVHIAGTSHLVRHTLTALEEELDPRTFVRIHRRHIVNLDRVVEVQPWYAGDAVAILKDKTQLRVSRMYRERFSACFLGERAVGE